MPSGVRTVYIRGREFRHGIQLPIRRVMHIPRTLQGREFRASIRRCVVLLLAGVALVAFVGCAGTRRIVLNPQRLPVKALSEQSARLEVMRIDGSRMTGHFFGASDSLLLLGQENSPRSEILDSLAYVTYLFPEVHRGKAFRKGFMRGIAIGLLDAALLTLIYSQADNDVNKNTLFWATAVSTAVPLTVYFTIEAGHNGRQLDDRDFVAISAKFELELR